MKWKLYGRITLSVLLSILAGGCERNDEQEGKASPQASADLVARRAVKPIAIDGALSEKLWNQTAETAAFVGPLNPIPGGLAGRPEYRTTARVLWDDHNLFIAFVCMAPEIFSTGTKHQQDEKLWEEDVTEVFLDVGGDGTRYLELQINSSGVTSAMMHHWTSPPSYALEKVDWGEFGKNHSMKYIDMKGLHAACAPLNKDSKQVGWTTEVAIPLKELFRDANLPPQLKSGQNFRLNCNRVVWLPDPKDNNKRIFHQLSWSPFMNGCPHASPQAMKTVVCKE